MPNTDVCAGGTVGANSTTITFTNHHPSSCTVTGLGNLVDCGNSFDVPARSGSTPGTKTCNVLPSAASGTYPYSASCCGPEEGNPVIIYQ